MTIITITEPAQSKKTYFDIINFNNTTQQMNNVSVCTCMYVRTGFEESGFVSVAMYTAACC